MTQPLTHDECPKGSEINIITMATKTATGALYS